MQKKHLKISNIAMFECHLLKTNKDIASQIRKFYGRLYVGGKFGSPHHTNICTIFFASVRRITFKLGNFALSSSVYKFFLTGHYQKLKNTRKGLFFAG